MKDTVARYFGLVSGYLIATTGHRKGVLVNLTVKAVREAKAHQLGGRLVHISDHKTRRKFGPATLALTEQEYGWLDRYLIQRHRVDGGLKATTFFHTWSGQPHVKLPDLFKTVWESMGLGVAPTFNLLRSSVATYTKRELGRRAYQRVAALMCHDPNTAMRFYHAEDPAEEIHSGRQMAISAINSQALKAKKAADVSDDPPERRLRQKNPQSKPVAEESSEEQELISSASSADWEPTNEGCQEDDYSSGEEEEEEELICISDSSDPGEGPSGFQKTSQRVRDVFIISIASMIGWSLLEINHLLSQTPQHTHTP
ncbi:uncharacterized protein LOC112155864 isoform X2 [Oryzias melastigma]|uniref:uncharacterized protein LOC112155864 isoform X2 n=1 Tax=Oryzias melastigma TaxID=30732 RepID=UPI00168D05F6|nr:uncharacterized protein LOC112155864 isoform X2 [Oryzias melastigma]